jgi:hypothetical protein
MNLNTDYDKDFTKACELTEKDFSHDDLISMLKSGNIQEKQYAAMSLDSVNNGFEGEVLINNLTGCDGKIREAVALKINQLLNKDSDAVLQYISPFAETFADASIDINANICMLVIDSVSVLKRDKHFSEIYLKKILNFIGETFAEIDKFIFRDKKYVINKQLFKLYCCLESLKLFVDDIEPDILFGILERAIQEKEYTVREKAAQILRLTENEIFLPLKEKLKADENYYVRAALLNQITQQPLL